MNFRGRMIYFCTHNKNSTPSGVLFVMGQAGLEPATKRYEPPALTN